MHFSLIQHGLAEYYIKAGVQIFLFDARLARALCPKDLLGPDEKARIERLPPALRPNRIFAYHALLRTLSHILAIPAGQVRITRSSSGKPYLSDKTGLDFGFSHSGRIICVAISENGPIGVDVETERPGIDVYAIAGDYFTHRERTCLARISTEKLLPAFLRFWVRKEAAGKAVGTGIAAALNLDVSASTASRIATIVDGRPVEIFDIPTANGAFVALAKDIGWSREH